MNKFASENLLLAGSVIRPHGRRGLLRIRSYAPSEQSFMDAGTIFLKSDVQADKKFTVLSVSPHKNFFLMKLQHLDSLSEAEKYRGAEILIAKNAVKHEHEDEYFWYELIGLKVYLNTGRYIGTIEHILETGGNDIYVTRDGGSEFLIPAIHDVVENIDLENRKMIIIEMEGLLDLNAV